MSLHAPLGYAIPELTIQVARAAFPKGNPYMQMSDTLGPIATNPDFAALFPTTGQPAEAPAHLALITIMQFAEGLSDAQAADAVRARIDWKYALALELTDHGFDSSVLSEFRTRLIAGNAELLLFETMLTRFRAQGLIKAKGRQRTDSTHVLAAIHVLNRLECVGETLRHALNTLATAVPDWLHSWVPTVWFDRYTRRFEEYRLPAEKPARYALAEQIGADGHQLLLAVSAPTAPTWVREVPAVQLLRQVWIQQFYATTADQPIRWRTAEDLPPARLLISSPYDPDARYGKKRNTEWTGYKVHLTETCDDDTPNLITDVTTTPATTSDVSALPTIQDQLDARQVTPGEHIVDSGYMSADHLLTSRADHQIDLLGPVADDHSWQTKAANGFGAAQFVLDWDAKQATCPQGQRSVIWMERRDRHGQATTQITFSKPICAACARRTDCTQSATAPRALLVRERDHYDALQAARERQQTDRFKAQYARRAGIEGTISQGVNTGDLRRSRYIGAVKTRLMHLLLAAAINFMRVANWLAETPRARTRRSSFAALAGAPS
ncbi:MAG: IS1182 family transposase [Roseiflexaceae bacterium]|jgi:transposase|nr:IS1182 family transposase [Roseiflexaceae bacterium]